MVHAKALLLFTFIISFLIALAAPIKSQEEVGLSVSPVVFELNADPGKSIVNELKVINPTDSVMNVEIAVEDFYPVGEEGQVILEEPGENDTYSIAKWTTVSPSQFTIQPKEVQIVKFTINLPHNAEPGGHYGSIVASVSGAQSEVSGPVIGTRRGTLILLRVSGKAEEKVDIESFSAQAFKEYGPVNFDIRFNNTGNIHMRPAGFIVITDMFGKQVDQIEIPQRNVIPGAVRKLEVEWNKKNLFGKYSATLVANYGIENKNTITSTFSFIVFPWKIVAIILTAVLLILLFLLKAKNRFSLAFKVLMGKTN